MQTFKTDHDAVFWTADDGEWVEAHVAQRLYDALKRAKGRLDWLDESHSMLTEINAALAAADGEEV